MKQIKETPASKKYELAVLVKPLLPDDIQTKVVKALEKLATEVGGTVKPKLEDQWGKKHLSYPIKKLDEGFYCYFTLEVEPSTVAKVSREMRLMADVLRFIIINESEL